MSLYRLGRSGNVLLRQVSLSSKVLSASPPTSGVTTSIFRGYSKLSTPAAFKHITVRTPGVQLKGFSSDAAPPSPKNKERFDKLVKANKIVVFMKGVPDEPRCGFSNAVIQILRMHGVTKTNYDAHNVLEDEDIRQGIKDYTSWPTIPQIFIDGEFIGGCDILLEMHRSGDLIEQLSKVGIKSALVD